MRSSRSRVILSQAEGCGEKSKPIDRQVVAFIIGGECPVAGFGFKSPLRGALPSGRADVKFLLLGIVKPFAGSINKLLETKKIKSVVVIPFSGKPTFIGFINAISKILLIGEGIGSRCVG
jgi:hypothetical protein